MDLNKIEMVQLPSGFRVPMSVDLYDNCYCEFTESQHLSFFNFINAGSCFPQIAQFVCVLLAILNGKTGWKDIVICSIGSGIIFTLLWFWGKCYKIPVISFMSCLIGGNIFRYHLHTIAIVAISLLVVKDWKVILFYAIGAAIAAFIRTIIFGKMSSVKHVDGVVKYVAGFKYKF
jgi:hypothetical protein